VLNIEAGSFGFAIAFLVPGAVGLWGIGQNVPTIREWFGATAESQATAGGFLFVLLASMAVGLVISGLRQEILDRLFFAKVLKIERPPLDEMKLIRPDVLAAVRFSAESYYRYYQFYANMAFAVTFAYVAWLAHDWGWSWWRVGGLGLLLLSVIVLIKSSTYSLERYYESLKGIFVG
jgi:hypothetical protein